jgi:hypothetical protein
MKYILSLILVLLNLINIPLSKLFLVVQRWYLPMWKKDKIIYFAFAPFYWVLVILTFIIGYPCEVIARLIH